MSHTPETYPLVFHPVVLEKVWGGRRLATLGKALSRPEAMYGESWELADLASTSSGGAGGQGVRSVIANGALAGKTIQEALNVWGDALLHHGALAIANEKSGSESRATQGGGAFPLLIKFLDAREDLSVQVHPSPEYAAAHADAHLKTECWYVMDAEPGAKIYIGIKPGVSREEFTRLAAANDHRIVDAMIALPAIRGECHELPSGTVHALGAGVLAAEVQTPSDTTYRLYDWGRAGRTLHVEQAMACAAFAPAPPPVRFDKSGMVGGSVQTPFFTLTHYRFDQKAAALGIHAGRVLMVVGGAGAIRGGIGEPIEVRRGMTLFVPQQLGAGWTIQSSSAEALEVLSVSIPMRSPRPNAAHA